MDLIGSEEKLKCKQQTKCPQTWTHDAEAGIQGSSAWYVWHGYAFASQVSRTGQLVVQMIEGSIKELHGEFFFLFTVWKTTFSWRSKRYTRKSAEFYLLFGQFDSYQPQESVALWCTALTIAHRMLWAHTARPVVVLWHHTNLFVVHFHANVRRDPFGDVWVQRLVSKFHPRDDNGAFLLGAAKHVGVADLVADCVDVVKAEVGVAVSVYKIKSWIFWVYGWSWSSCLWLSCLLKVRKKLNFGLLRWGSLACSELVHFSTGVVVACDADLQALVAGLFCWESQGGGHVGVG